MVSSRWSALFAAIMFAAVTVSGCWKYAPDHCTSGAMCASGVCDMRTMGCVPVDAGADGTTGGPDGPVDHTGVTADVGADRPTDGSGRDGQPMSGCSTKTECQDPVLPICEIPTRLCVGCLQSTDCPTSGKQVCDTTAKTCVSCLLNADCTTTGTPVCESASKTCVACVQNTDCKVPGVQVCEASSKTCVGCLQNTDCTTTGKLVCETTSKTCVGCLQSSDCTVAGKRVCDTGARTCIGCLANSDCSGTSPICDAKMCRACTKDAECTNGPGICLSDGHCAANAETIFVEFNAGGCAGADGSSAKPYCAPNDGVAAMTNARHTIVIRGAAADRMTLATTGLAPVIVGRKGSSGDVGSIPAGGAIGLTVSSDQVLVRDLSVLGGTASTGKGIAVSGAATSVSLLRVVVSNNVGVGVQADTGAALRMDECLIQGNMSGGVLVNGASYDIQNTIVAGNAYGLRFTASAISAGSQARFNTVIGTGGIALTCDPSNPQPLLASIVTGLNDSCTLTNSITIAPTFDSARPFHLTAKLPCPSGDPATFPDHDVDGARRTKPLDCGADQF